MLAKTDADELIAFVAARLAEAESQAVLHEVTCTAVAGEPTVGRGRCGCPAQRVARVHALQRVLRDCEQQIRREHPNSPHLPLDVIGAEQSLRALARLYDGHPQWHQEWCPEGDAGSVSWSRVNGRRGPLPRALGSGPAW